MNNIIVCFPGGTGGHFIGNICYELLFNKSFSVLTDGSMHNSKFYFHPKSLEGRILDRSKTSYQQELEVISELNKFEISVGHFRYLDELVRTGRKVIYITFDNDDKEIIYNRLHKKTNPLDISELHYNVIKGIDWPTYAEFKNGIIHPEILIDRLEKDWLIDWFYKLPDQHDNICEIKFKEILKGNTLLEKLCNFLNVTTHSDSVNRLIEKYRESQ